MAWLESAACNTSYGVSCVGHEPALTAIDRSVLVQNSSGNFKIFSNGTFVVADVPSPGTKAISMVAAGFSLTDAASRLHARFAGACGCLGFRHRGNTSLTSGCGIFTMAEHMSARAPIFAPGESSVIYWVAYQRGSFSVKERYLCPDQARSRCSDLITEARYIRIIPTEEAELQLLNQCFELPAIS